MESNEMNVHFNDNGIRSHIKQRFNLTNQQTEIQSDQQEFHQNDTEFNRKLTELLEWQKEQEEQVKLAEEFTLKLKRELEKADIKEFQYRSVDEIVTTDQKHSNDESDEFNDTKNFHHNQSNNEFNERSLSDIESFEQGLSNDAEHQSKHSTPKETTYQRQADDGGEEDDEAMTYNSLNKQYTKHCTEECTKQDFCSHTIRISESYEQILKIISNYNEKLKNGVSVNDLEDKESLEEKCDVEHDDEIDETIETNHVDFKEKLKQKYSSSNQNIYKLNEFFKEELTKSLDPALNNEQYVLRSLSETNLNYSQDESFDHRSMGKGEMKSQKDFKKKLRNRTFSSDEINNHLRSIEDLSAKNIENVPIRPGIDGENVKTFDELLNQQLSHYKNSSSLFTKPSTTKRPFLKKGAGLKRFQSRSTSEPYRGKLCKIRNQKMKQIKQQQEDKKIIKKHIDSDRKLPDPKRIEYLAQPKFTINRDYGAELDKENILYKSNQRIDTMNRDYITSNLSDKFDDKLNEKRYKMKAKTTIIPVLKISDKDMVKDDKINQKVIINESEQANKKAKIQLISKISLNKSYHHQKDEKSVNDFVVIEKEWNKKETIEDSNKRLESLLEKFIELYEAKNNTKADRETRQHLIGMLKNSLRMEDNNSTGLITCRECGNREESEDSESESFCCNPIEADRTSSKFSNDPDTLLVTPKIGVQTIALRNKIEKLQRRLTNLQSRCGQDEKRIDKSSNCQSFSNKGASNECTCSGQMEMLKEKLNFITNTLRSIEKSTLLNAPTESHHSKASNTRTINHRIVIDEPGDKKTRRISKPGNLKSKSMQETNRKKNSTFHKTEIEKQTNNQRGSPNDLIVQKSIDDDSIITKYRSGLKIVEKSDGTVEKICSNGYQEILFADDTLMRVLMDGTKIIDYPNGEREIRTTNYRRREFLDGSVKTEYNDGTKEIRYLDGKLRVKDRYGNLIIDSRIPGKN